jgi:hypothetical protein
VAGGYGSLTMAKNEKKLKTIKGEDFKFEPNSENKYVVYMKYDDYWFGVGCGDTEDECKKVLAWQRDRNVRGE